MQFAFDLFMKKSMKIKMIGILTFLTCFSAFADDGGLIRCRTEESIPLFIDISDLKAPILLKGSDVGVSTVISRDESLLTLTGATLDTLEMTSIEFKVADLQIPARGLKTIKGLLSVAEGPGSAFKASDLVCVMSVADRINLLSLKSNSKW